MNLYCFQIKKNIWNKREEPKKLKQRLLPHHKALDIFSRKSMFQSLSTNTCSLQQHFNTSPNKPTPSSSHPSSNTLHYCPGPDIIVWSTDPIKDSCCCRLCKVPENLGHPWLLKHPVTDWLHFVLTQGNICLLHHMFKQALTWNRQPFYVMSQTLESFNDVPLRRRSCFVCFLLRWDNCCLRGWRIYCCRHLLETLRVTGNTALEKDKSSKTFIYRAVNHLRLTMDP